MISFDGFSLQDGSPIYLQILLFLKRGIAAGNILSGDELPSRRVLSARLGINPNTVQKAYRILEEQGLLASHAGAKSCMVLDEEKIARIRRELLENEARHMVRSLRQMGVTLTQAHTLIDTFWHSDEDLQ